MEEIGGKAGWQQALNRVWIAYAYCWHGVRTRQVIRAASVDDANERDLNDFCYVMFFF